MSHINYSTDIPKHYVRRNGWLSACRKQAAFVKKRSKRIPLRYFTFCAADAIDVFMLEREGVVKRSEDSGRLEGVYFCEKDDEAFGTIAALIGSPEQGFRGKFEKIVLFSDDDTEGKSIEDDVPFTSEVRKKLQYKDAHSRFQSSFPFDIINLDVVGVLFPLRKGIITPLLKSIIQILQWQTESNFSINNKASDQFTLFLTSHIDPDRTDREAIGQLKNRLRDNLAYEKFRIEFGNKFGHEDVDKLAGEQFSEFFCVALPKYFIHHALFTLGWKVVHGPSFLYARENKWGENKTYQIMHSVSVFERIPDFEQRLDQPTISTYTDAVIEILAKGIVLVDALIENPENSTMLEEDLRQIVEYRDRFS
jgi:hypothetical protein